MLKFEYWAISQDLILEIVKMEMEAFYLTPQYLSRIFIVYQIFKPGSGQGNPEDEMILKLSLLGRFDQGLAEILRVKEIEETTTYPQLNICQC